LLYIYTCSSEKGCGHTFDRSMSVKDWKSRIKCPKCGRMAHQNLLAQHSSGGIDSQMREYTMEGECGTRLYGASYLDNQINEARKKHPGTDFVRYNNCWLPKIKNRVHKLRYLKQYGNYVEYD